MKVEVKRLPKSRAELSICVPVEEVQKDIEQAARAISRERTFDGFRPGKAPVDVVKRALGEARLLERALQYMIPRTFLAAMRQEQLEGVGKPEVSVTRLVPQQDICYVARVSVLPEVRVGDVGSVRVKKNSVEVSEEKVDKMLADLQKMRAQTKEVDRPAKEGDKVLVDIEVSLAGVPVEGGTQRGAMIWIGEDSMIPGFIENIIGAKKGDKKEFDLVFPGEYHVKHLAGKKGEFSVSVLKVFEVVMPEINDEFASSLGSFQNVAELREKLRENLRKEEEHEEEMRLEREILKQVISKSTFGELPDVLVQHEMEESLRQLKQDIERSGTSFSDWLSRAEKSEEDVRSDLAPHAEERVKAALVTRAIARAENIEVSDEEIEKEINAILARYPGMEEMEKRVRTDEYRDMIRREIENRKVVAWLKERCVQEGRSKKEKQSINATK